MAKKAVRVFLDSNVILSGLISDKGAPLKKKLPGLLPIFRKYLPLLNLRIIPLPSPQEIREFAGKIADKDVPVLASAIKAKADFLVTGDKQHFQKLKAHGEYPLRIVTPAEFVDRILPEILKEMGQSD
jgi:predicted nucleic acid-binding protein